MGQVIELRQKDAAPSENMQLLTELIEQEKRGELKGFMPMMDTDHGTELCVTGSFSDRPRWGGYMLVKALSTVAEWIAKSEASGEPPAPLMRETLYQSPKRRLPKRLREVTALGDLQ